MIAPTIDASDVGEAWVAYQWAAHLSARFEVTVLTYRKNGAPPIAPQLPRARVIEWREPPLVGRFERFNSLLKPGYFIFALAASRWIAAAERRREVFDVAHQVVPVAMRYPTPLRGSAIPYVMGPVGGSLSSPEGFRDADSGPWYQRLRALDRWRLRHDPALRASYERAAVVLGIADYVGAFLDGLKIRRFEVLSETGLLSLPAPLQRHVPDRFTRHNPLRLLFVGRVIRTKGARDLVAALARLGADAPVELDVVGEGFDLTATQQLAKHLGISDRVRFHGWKDKDAVQEQYRRAHVFAFPSYREPGGNVVFEAMGNGLPLIVCDRGGPGAAVDNSCAFALPAHDPEQLAEDIANAVRRFLDDPSLVLSMGAAARRRLIEVGLWSSKIDRMEKLYHEVRRPASR